MRLASWLSSEDWGAAQLVEQAHMAQAAGSDELYVNQIRPDQEGRFAAYRHGGLPRYAD